VDGAKVKALKSVNIDLVLIGIKKNM